MRYSPLASPGATAEVLARFGLSTRKSLGQHFLIDDHIVGRTIELAGIGPADAVLEVGPGIGTLTVALLARSAGVVAIEKDAGLLPVLHETCAQDGERLAIVEGDAVREMTPDAIDAAARSCGIPVPRMLVANLPYAVAATVVLDFFERMPDAISATVMVQSEVADRMAAAPGTKDYGAYSVKLALRAKPAGRFQVSPGCFFPPPRVESAVIRLERTAVGLDGMPASEELVRAASMAADACFLQRRKTVRNSLAAYLKSTGLQAAEASRSAGPEQMARTAEAERRAKAGPAADRAAKMPQAPDASALLEAAGIDPGVRGETLLLEDYLRLGRVFEASGLTKRNA